MDADRHGVLGSGDAGGIECADLPALSEHIGDCHRCPRLGIHGEKRMWAIHKMDELDALNVTIRGLVARR